MATSRRKFLKAGMLAALFVASPVEGVFSQSWKDRDGNPNDPQIPQSDPLSNYSKAAFRSYLNSIFELHTVFGIVAVTLTQVNDMPSPRNGECFGLLFRGGGRALRQDTYVLVHPSLGTFSLLLVPTGPDRSGAQGYLATINRLSYGDALNNPAPTRSISTKLSPDTPAAVPTSAPSPAITVDPVTAPAIIPPVQPAAPATTAPQALPKLKRKRRPSWKSVDQRIVS